MAEKLVGLGASIDLRAKNGRTALILASAEGHGEVAEKLVGMGASIDLRAANGRTALMMARAAGHEVVARMLGGKAQEPRCSNSGCGRLLQKPLQCARCRKALYCSRDCQVAAWKGGHKRECGAAAGGGGARKSKGHK